MKTASELFRCVENGEIKLLREALNVAAIALAFLPNELADIAPVAQRGKRA
jgi:hypothetical protein